MPTQETPGPSQQCLSCPLTRWGERVIPSLTVFSLLKMEQVHTDFLGSVSLDCKYPFDVRNQFSESHYHWAAGRECTMWWQHCTSVGAATRRPGGPQSGSGLLREHHGYTQGDAVNTAHSQTHGIFYNTNLIVEMD